MTQILSFQNEFASRMRITHFAFTLRFPMAFPADPGSFARKFHVMQQFLANDALASELEPSAEVRKNLRFQIQAGLDLMNQSKCVDLALPYAAAFTARMSAPDVPSLFRLTTSERDTILSLAIADGERYRD